MQELPAYFETFSEVLPTEVIEILASIEVSFDKVNFRDHQDRINEALLVDDAEVTLRDVVDEAVIYYRSSIVSVLTEQGITIEDGLNVKLNLLADVFNAVTLLGTDEVKGEFEDVEVEEEDDLVYVCTIIAVILDTNVENVLGIISAVDPATAAIIRSGNEFLESDPATIIDERAKARFMNEIGSDRTGIVCDYIRESNTFGYNLPTIRQVVAEEIEASLDEVALKEVRRLVLGSGVPDEMIDAEIRDTIELIFDPKRAIRLLARS